MELRVHIPTTWPAWRYCLKHPRSFIIGTYGFRRYKKIRYSALIWASKFHREQMAHEATRDKLIDAQKQLSKLKRGQ